MHAGRIRKQLTQREVGKLEQSPDKFWRQPEIEKRWINESCRADSSLNGAEVYRRRRQKAGV